MHPKIYSKLYAASMIALLFFVWTGCGGGRRPANNAGAPPSNANAGGQPPQQLPDLAIAKIEVLPAQPQARHQFAVNVYVTNVGQAPSGDYDILISIKDVSRQLTYPVGTFRNGGLRPGEQVTAYRSTERMVNYSGSHQIHVELRPFQFQDGNDRNDVLSWAFSVSD